MDDPDTRYDFGMEDAVTPGETWNFLWNLRIKQPDGTFDPAESFTGYANWALYILHRLSSALESAYCTATPVAGTPPEITAEIPSSDNDSVPVGTRAYELWATVGGKPKRLAYGTIPVVD